MTVNPKDSMSVDSVLVYFVFECASDTWNIICCAPVIVPFVISTKNMTAESGSLDCRQIWTNSLG